MLLLRAAMGAFNKASPLCHKFKAGVRTRFVDSRFRLSTNLVRFFWLMSWLNSQMNTTLESDLQRLRSLADEREIWGGPLIRRIHGLPTKARKHAGFQFLRMIHPWLFSPVSLWPTNLDSFGNHLVTLIRRNHELGPEIGLLCQFLVPPPTEETNALISNHERRAQQFDFSHFIHSTHKYAFLEDKLTQNKKIQEEWRIIGGLFDVQKYQDSNGIVQRQFVHDWNIRTILRTEWNRREDRFYAIFNAFCCRWHLFGMAGDKPIILKSSVDMTPFGTVIFVPYFWSLDARRDIKWKSIRAMHRSRGAINEGVKLGLSRTERRAQAEQVRKLLEQAKAQGIRAPERVEWVMGQLGWDNRNEMIRVRRLMSLLKDEP